MRKDSISSLKQEIKDFREYFTELCQQDKSLVFKNSFPQGKLFKFDCKTYNKYVRCSGEYGSETVDKLLDFEDEFVDIWINNHKGTKEA